MTDQHAADVRPQIHEDGLPGSEAEWMRLDAALQALSEAKVCA